MQKSLFFTIGLLGALSSLSSQEKSCGNEPLASRFTLRHIESQGIGYKTGYSTGELFIGMSSLDAKYFPFLELRGHVFDNGKPAANVGLGVRMIPQSWCHVLGANIFYDYRKSRNHLNNHQIGLGLEMLGTTWDVRFNGYIPVGTTQSHFFDHDFKKFDGNSIILQRKQEYSLHGFNLEGGAHTNKKKNYDFYLGAGPYYFQGKVGKAAVGAKARLVGNFWEYVRAELSGSYDTVFHGIVQGELAINIPLCAKKSLPRVSSGCMSSCSRAIELTHQLVQPIDRQEIIVINRRKKTSQAINPLTGEPYVVWFVDNTSSSNGTVESPFPTLLDAQDASSQNDIIYVFFGDGTSNKMDEGITLKDDQKLWGSGDNQTLVTTKGNYTVPAMTNGRPTITNLLNTPLLPVVNIASNNEIAGMNISIGDSGFGIFNFSGHEVANLLITNNSFVNELAALNVVGVDLQNIVNTLVENNTFTYSHPGIGVQISHTAEPVNNVAVIGNQFTNVTNGFQVNGFLQDSSGNLAISSNTFISSENGILVNLGNKSNYNVAILSNVFGVVQPTSGVNITLVSRDNAIALAAINNNHLSPNTPLVLSVSTNDTSSLCLAIDSNQAVNSGVTFAQNNTSVFKLQATFHNGITGPVQILPPGSPPGTIQLVQSCE